jgi:hypothetical protein
LTKTSAFTGQIKKCSIIKNDDVGYSSVSRRAGRARGRAEGQGVDLQHTRGSSGGTAGAAATGGTGTATIQTRCEASRTTRAKLSQGSSSYLLNKRGEHRGQTSIGQAVKGKANTASYRGHSHTRRALVASVRKLGGFINLRWIRSSPQQWPDSSAGSPQRTGSVRPHMSDDRRDHSGCI